MKPETCVSCGSVIPEGRQVCRSCEIKSKTQEQTNTNNTKDSK